MPIRLVKVNLTLLCNDNRTTQVFSNTTYFPPVGDFFCIWETKPNLLVVATSMIYIKNDCLPFWAIALPT